jgi:hypothetical protein
MQRAVYTAIQAGRITPRGDLLGARITFPQAPEFTSWRRLYRAVQRGDKTVITEMLNAPAMPQAADDVWKATAKRYANEI